MIKRIVSSIPNAITCCNLLSGCIAVIFAFNLDAECASLSGRQWVYISIFAAAVFDFCDGLSARALHAYSDIGKELDSLSDLVSFGVAPGMLIFNTMLGAGTPAWLAASALIVPVFGGLRLAKFNVDTEQSHTFKGLPIPANALFWIGMVSFWQANHPQDSQAWSTTSAILIVAMALAMLAPVRLPSLKFHSARPSMENSPRYIIIIATALLVAWLGVPGLAVAIALYFLYGAVKTLTTRSL